MKKYNKIYWIIAILPLIITLLCMPFLPQKVPIHFNLSNTIDGWGNKYIYIPMATINILIYIVINILFKNVRIKDINPQRICELENNKKIVYKIVTCILIINIILIVFLLYIACFKKVTIFINMDFMSITSLIIGIIFIVFGNFMTKFKINGVVGIRTKWSMTNEATWGLSQLYGGIIFIISGLMLIIGAFIFKTLISMIFLIVISSVASVICIYFSYIAYKKINN